MQIGPFTIARTKALTLAPLSSRGRGWWPIVRESFTGAWQQNVEVKADDVLANPAAYACVTLIAGDIAKLTLRLVEQDTNGIWEETSSPAFSPFLRKPNQFQNRIKFIEQWIVSKLTRGNTYALKKRDARGVVVAAYILDPSRVTPLVTATGDVYYEIQRDDLSQLEQERLIVPAREMFHDIMCALWHPLIGVSPIYACGVAALQGLSIQSNSLKFFANGANPAGHLSAPGAISDETAARLKAKFTDATTGAPAQGGVLVTGDGIKYEPFTMTAVDSQLIDQLKWTADTVCSVFHVPPYMIGVGPPPPYANIEPLLQQYYSQCIQSLLTSLEVCLDEGLGLTEKIDGRQFGVEFDIDDLLWMDTATRTKAATDSIAGSGMSPNEARKKYLGLGPIAGGESAYMQQQNYSLEALAKRDAADPFEKPAPAPRELVPADADGAVKALLTAKALELRARMEGGRRVA